MVQKANTIWRDYVTDGVPSSGDNDPNKADIRAMLTALENGVAGAAAGATIYDSKADMDADISQAANAMAWVLGDDTAANNGVYQFDGTSTWIRLGDLPYSYIKAANAGAGTADAIVATTSIPIPEADDAALIALPIAADNTASPATVAFNGGTALTIKTSSGNDITVGGLTAGMIVAGYVSGSTFRLLSDQASAAFLDQAEAAKAAAEAAQEAAEAAQAAAQAAVPSVFPTSLAGLAAVDSSVHSAAYLKAPARLGQFFWSSSNLASGVTDDPAKAFYVPPSTDTTGASGAFVRADPRAFPLEWFTDEADPADETDWSTALKRACTTVKNMNVRGAFVDCAAKSYPFLTINNDIDPVAIRGVPGRTVFDFSGTTGWANTDTDAYIRCRGEETTTTQDLTADAVPSPDYVLRATSATRSGTTVTVNTEVDHGLATGDIVWTMGGSTSTTTGQKVFYPTLNLDPGSTEARSMPIAVIVTDDNTLTFEVEDTGDTTLTGSLWIRPAAEVVIVADTSGFSAGDVVQVRSEAVYDDGSSLPNHIGERFEVARVLSSTWLMLDHDVRDRYLISDARRS